MNGAIVGKSGGRKNHLYQEKRVDKINRMTGVWGGGEAHRNSEKAKNIEKTHSPTKQLWLSCGFVLREKKGSVCKKRVDLTLILETISLENQGIWHRQVDA